MSKGWKLRLGASNFGLSTGRVEHDLSRLKLGLWADFGLGFRSQNMSNIQIDHPKGSSAKYRLQHVLWHKV
jgi:hypothetical protein